MAANGELTPFTFDLGGQPSPEDDEIVLFPKYIEGDVGVYRPELIQLSKRLAADGMNVRYAHPPERRTWLREYSSSAAWLDIAIGVGSGVPWFVVQQILDRRKPKEVRLKITKARKVKGQRMWGAEVIELSGTPTEVAGAWRKMDSESKSDD